MSSEPADGPDADGPMADRQSGQQPRVAVDVLQRDQRAVLFDGDADREPPISPVVDGFANQRELLNWWQATCVRSFGHLAKIYEPVQIRRDKALTDALTASDPTAGQRRQRRRLREHVMTACSTAYRDLEKRANEWLPTDGPERSQRDYRNMDPATQEHIAMRPAFSRLDDGQANVLSRLWGGFEDREAILRWCHDLPAVADFSGVLEEDAAVTEWLITDREARSKLTDRSESGRAWRERFAATVLLPAFAVRTLRLQGGERAEATHDERTVPHG